MKTTAEVEAEFKAELSALLAKYNTELEATNRWRGYAKCGQDIRMEVYINGIYDEHGNTIQEPCNVDLGEIFEPT